MIQLSYLAKIKTFHYSYHIKPKLKTLIRNLDVISPALKQTNVPIDHTIAILNT